MRSEAIQDIETALLQPDAIPLLLVGEMVRTKVPVLASTDSLSRAMELFALEDVGTLGVCVPEHPERIVGVISHQYMVRRYHEVLDETH